MKLHFNNKRLVNKGILKRFHVLSWAKRKLLNLILELFEDMERIEGESCGEGFKGSKSNNRY